jgi:hypothetical protein
MQPQLQQAQAPRERVPQEVAPGRSGMNRVALYARCSTREKQDPDTQLIPLRDFARQRQLDRRGEARRHLTKGQGRMATAR